MREQPASPEEHKFDTLSLLAGLADDDTGRYSLDDILSEFGGWKEQTGGEPPEPVETPEPAPAPEAETGEPSIVEQIQHAIDREMEMNMATPEPVIRLGEEQSEEASQASIL